MKKLKIYFAGSIMGGRSDSALYAQIIEYLKEYGEVLTEHVGIDDVLKFEAGKSYKYIHDRDMEWLLSSDVVVAEITTASLGVGYEIGRAVEHKRPVLCIHRNPEGKRISAMIAGSESVKTISYITLEDAKKIISLFFKELQ